MRMRVFLVPKKIEFPFEPEANGQNPFINRELFRIFVFRRRRKETFSLFPRNHQKSSADNTKDCRDKYRIEWRRFFFEFKSDLFIEDIDFVGKTGN
jgi:hypothetical protein